VLRVLAVATLLGAADGLVVTLLDAIGQPRINAKFSVIELILFIPLLFLMLHLFGFVGGAVAYVTRVAIDFVVRLWLAARFYPAIVTQCRRVALTTLSGTALLLPLLAVSGIAERCAAIGIVTACFGLVLYTRSATDEDRLLVRSKVAAMMPAAWRLH
jgi:O-antigen/teichoic acid export membrane protein